MSHSILLLRLGGVAAALLLSACSAVLDDPLPYPEEPQEMDMYIPPPPDLSVTPSDSERKGLEGEAELEGGVEGGSDAGAEADDEVEG